MIEDIIITEKAVHHIEKSGIFVARISDAHLKMIELIKVDYPKEVIAILLGVDRSTITSWLGYLSKFGMKVQKDYLYRFPCEICHETIFLYSPEIPKRIRCKKHRQPLTWINADTPAWTTKGEYQKYLYHHSPTRHKKSSEHTKLWVQRKKATDPEWYARYREYHRKYREMKKSERNAILKSV